MSRKAFDSLSQDAILNDLPKQRFDQSSIQLLKNLYEDCTTFLSVGSWHSDKIKIKRGVKQGDPLSPFLFNLVIDELLEKANLSGLGVRLRSGQLAALAYADDLLLLAETDGDLQTLIDLTNEFYGSVGLSANPNKSFTIGNASQLIIDGSSISSDDKLKYLGVTIDDKNKHDSMRHDIAPLLDKLKKASLRPNQKLYRTTNCRSCHPASSAAKSGRRRR